MQKVYSEAVCRRRTDNIMTKRKKTNGQTKYYTENYRSSNTNRIENWGWTWMPQKAVLAPLVAPIIYLMLKIQWWNIHGHLWYRYSVTVDQVMMAIIQISKWRLLQGTLVCFDIFSLCFLINTWLGLLRSCVEKAALGVLYQFWVPRKFIVRAFSWDSLNISSKPTMPSVKFWLAYFDAHTHKLTWHTFIFFCHI
jgi:hypothetical protein